jgi:hypothetical protein
MILNKERIQGFEESRVQVNVGEGLVPSRVLLCWSGDQQRAVNNNCRGRVSRPKSCFYHCEEVI